MLPSMTPRLTIEWEPHLHPVAGEVTAGTASPQTFTGWLELLALLQAALAAGADDLAATDLKEEP